MGCLLSPNFHVEEYCDLLFSILLLCVIIIGLHAATLLLFFKDNTKGSSQLFCGIVSSLTVPKYFIDEYLSANNFHPALFAPAKHKLCSRFNNSISLWRYLFN